MAEELTFEEFAAKVQPTPNARKEQALATQPEEAAEPASLLAPLTQQQALVARRKLATERSSRPQSRSTVDEFQRGAIAQELAWEDLGQRPGVRLNMDTGSPELRGLFAKFPTPQEGLFAINQRLLKDGEGATARLNKFGDPVITRKVDGEEQDFLVNPVGPDMSDVSAAFQHDKGQLTGSLVGAVGTALATRGISLAPAAIDATVKVVLEAIGTTIGQEAGGMLQDMGARKEEGLPQQPVVAERMGNVTKDLTLNTLTGGAARLGGFLVSPLMRQPFDALAAQERLANRFGMELPLSVGQSTGNRLLMKSEAFASSLPGSSSPFERFNRRLSDTIRAMRDIAEGRPPPGGMGPPLPPPAANLEATGEEALNTLRSRVAAEVEHPVQRAAHAAATQAEAEILPAFGATRVNKATLGEGMRQGAMQRRQLFDDISERLYGAVRADPRALERNIAARPLANDSRDLIARLPTERITEITPSGLLDAHGNPIMTTSTVDRVMPEFVPSGVLEKARRMAGTEGELRLSDLMGMRTEVRNAIKQGEAIPGVQTGYLEDMRQMLTRRIQEGLNDVDPDLAAMWQTANDYYAANAPRFKRAGISELFRTPEQGAAFLQPEEIVNRATSGKKATGFYQAYSEFFGPNSGQMRQLREAIKDDVLNRSSMSPVIDADGLVRRLDELDTDAPDVLNDVFGRRQATELRNAGQVLRASQGAQLPAAELNQAINSGQLSGVRLREMITAEAERTRRYNNTILKAVKGGSFEPSEIRPTELVDRLVFNNDTQPGHLREVMGMMASNPEAAEDIRRLTFKRVLDDATIRTAGGSQTVDAIALEKMLQDPKLRPRLEAVLGTGRLGNMQDLEDMVTFFRSSSEAFHEFRTSGRLASGSWLGGLIKTGEFSYLSQWAKNIVIATAYTSHPLRRYVTNQGLNQSNKQELASLFIASGPWLRAVSETVGHESAIALQTEMKQSIDRKGAERARPVLDLQDFEQRLQSQQQP